MHEMFSAPERPASAGKVLEAADVRAATQAGKHRGHPAVRALGAISEIADQAPAMAACSVIAAAGLLLRRPKLAGAGLRMLASVALATAIKAATKRVVRRDRPRVLLDGADRSENSHEVSEGDRHSFPSGHTADAFAAALALSRSYPEARLPALAAAALIAAIQVPRAKHYPADVVAGAATGAVAELTVHHLGRAVRS